MLEELSRLKDLAEGMTDTAVLTAEVRTAGIPTVVKMSLLWVIADSAPRGLEPCRGAVIEELVRLVRHRSAFGG